MGAAADSPIAAALWPVDAHEVGRIVDAWGIKGWIKVDPFSSDPQALIATRCWYLKPPEDARAIRQPANPVRYPSSLELAEVRQHGDAVIARAQGITSRSEAESLRGARVFISRSSFPAVAIDEYYWVDLIGLEVRNRDGIVLGTVEGLIDTGAQSVLRVCAEGAAERLIPFVAAYVDDVDIATRVVTVDWGLEY